MGTGSHSSLRPSPALLVAAGLTLSLGSLVSLGTIACGSTVPPDSPRSSREAPPAKSPELVAKLIQASELAQLEAPPADARVAYGDASPLQFGHLRLPAAAAQQSGDRSRLPVVIFVHGGCWLSQFDIAHAGALEVAFAEAGYAVWSLEYRRVGDHGGGWPGTFLDLATGADHLRNLAERFPLDLERVIAAGHSAGGQLALWLASRHLLPPDSVLATEDPLEIHGVLALAPAPDLEDLQRRGVCGGVVNGLLGGGPDEVPARYAAASPMLLPPLPVPATVVIGGEDHSWAPGGLAYVERFSEHSDLVLERVARAGHFEVIAPHTPAFQRVLDALAELSQRMVKDRRSLAP